MPTHPLTHHAVALGATGSGKTGLCVGTLEELALAGVPILALDPKGDLADLALTSPTLAPQDFAAWIDPASAARDGVTVEALAERTAAAWRAGLAADGRGPSDVAAFRERVEVTVLTPGSDAGVPVDVLTALTRAPAGLADDPEGLGEYVTGAVGALLGLVGRAADPLTDPATILLSRLLGDAFAAGRDLPLDVLLPAIVDPPFDRLGFFPVETFLPRRERTELALALNALVASPAFAAWRRGVPLDVDAWLAPVTDARGVARTPIRVVYLAHLDDAERMFFVTLLLHAVLAWTRRLPGTGQLRALVYLDEAVGYLPPYPRDPPSKAPLMTLIKQARAVGVGVMVATQNPVDLDHKALSNAATWYVGRLPSRQDRDRVVEVLELGEGDAAALHDRIAALPARTFLWRDATRGTVTELRSRHTLCYLRGPLTRREVAALPQARPASAAGVPADGRMRAPPPVPEGWEVRWLDPAAAPAWGLAAVGDVGAYEPLVLVGLKLRFDDGRWIDRALAWRVLRPTSRDAVPAAVPVDERHLLRAPPAPGLYAPLPGWLDERRELDRLRAAVRSAAVEGEAATRWVQPRTGAVSAPGEDRAGFEARLRAAGLATAGVEAQRIPPEPDDVEATLCAVVWVPA